MLTKPTYAKDQSVGVLSEALQRYPHIIDLGEALCADLASDPDVDFPPDPLNRF